MQQSSKLVTDDYDENILPVKQPILLIKAAALGAAAKFITRGAASAALPSVVSKAAMQGMKFNFKRAAKIVASANVKHSGKAIAKAAKPQNRIFSMSAIVRAKKAGLTGTKKMKEQIAKNHARILKEGKLKAWQGKWLKQMGYDWKKFVPKEEIGIYGISKTSEAMARKAMQRKFKFEMWKNAARIAGKSVKVYRQTTTKEERDNMYNTLTNWTKAIDFKPPDLGIDAKLPSFNPSITSPYRGSREMRLNKLKLERERIEYLGNNIKSNYGAVSYWDAIRASGDNYGDIDNRVLGYCVDKRNPDYESGYKSFKELNCSKNQLKACYRADYTDMGSCFKISTNKKDPSMNMNSLSVSARKEACRNSSEHEWGASKNEYRELEFVGNVAGRESVQQCADACLIRKRHNSKVSKFMLPSGGGFTRYDFVYDRFDSSSRDLFVCANKLEMFKGDGDNSGKPITMPPFYETKGSCGVDKMTKAECKKLSKSNENEMTMSGKFLSGLGTSLREVTTGGPYGCHIQEYADGKGCSEKDKEAGVCNKYVYWNSGKYESCGHYGRSCLCMKRDRDYQKDQCAYACRTFLQKEGPRSSVDIDKKTCKDFAASRNLPYGGFCSDSSKKTKNECVQPAIWTPASTKGMCSDPSITGEKDCPKKEWTDYPAKCVLTSDAYGEQFVVFNDHHSNEECSEEHQCVINFAKDFTPFGFKMTDSGKCECLSKVDDVPIMSARARRVLPFLQQAKCEKLGMCTNPNKTTKESCDLVEPAATWTPAVFLEFGNNSKNVFTFTNRHGGEGRCSAGVSKKQTKAGERIRTRRECHNACIKGGHNAGFAFSSDDGCYCEEEESSNCEKPCHCVSSEKDDKKENSPFWFLTGNNISTVDEKDCLSRPSARRISDPFLPRGCVKMTDPYTRKERMVFNGLPILEENDCKRFAESQGKKWGGASDYSTKGCYISSRWNDHVFFGYNVDKDGERDDSNKKGMMTTHEVGLGKCSDPSKTTKEDCEREDGSCSDPSKTTKEACEQSTHYWEHSDHGWKYSKCISRDKNWDMKYHTSHSTKEKCESEKYGTWTAKGPYTWNDGKLHPEHSRFSFPSNVPPCIEGRECATQKTQLFTLKDEKCFCTADRDSCKVKNRCETTEKKRGLCYNKYTTWSDCISKSNCYKRDRNGHLTASLIDECIQKNCEAKGFDSFEGKEGCGAASMGGISNRWKARCVTKGLGIPDKTIKDESVCGKYELVRACNENTGRCMCTTPYWDCGGFRQIRKDTKLCPITDCKWNSNASNWISDASYGCSFQSLMYEGSEKGYFSPWARALTSMGKEAVAGVFNMENNLGDAYGSAFKVLGDTTRAGKITGKVLGFATGMALTNLTAAAGVMRGIGKWLIDKPWEADYYTRNQKKMPDNDVDQMIWNQTCVKSTSSPIQNNWSKRPDNKCTWHDFVKFQNPMYRKVTDGMCPSISKKVLVIRGIDDADVSYMNDTIDRCAQSCITRKPALDDPNLGMWAHHNNWESFTKPPEAFVVDYKTGRCICLQEKQTCKAWIGGNFKRGNIGGISSDALASLGTFNIIKEVASYKPHNESKDTEVKLRNASWMKGKDIDGYCNMDLRQDEQFSIDEDYIQVTKKKSGVCEERGLSEAQCIEYQGTSEHRCKNIAESQGKKWGGASDYTTKGCYISKTWNDHVFFGYNVDSNGKRDDSNKEGMLTTHENGLHPNVSRPLLWLDAANIPEFKMEKRTSGKCSSRERITDASECARQSKSNGYTFMYNKEGSGLSGCFISKEGESSWNPKGNSYECTKGKPCLCAKRDVSYPSGCFTVKKNGKEYVGFNKRTSVSGPFECNGLHGSSCLCYKEQNPERFASFRKKYKRKNELIINRSKILKGVCSDPSIKTETECTQSNESWQNSLPVESSTCPKICVAKMCTGGVIDASGNCRMQPAKRIKDIDMFLKDPQRSSCKDVSVAAKVCDNFAEHNENAITLYDENASKYGFAALGDTDHENALATTLWFKTNEDFETALKVPHDKFETKLDGEVCNYTENTEIDFRMKTNMKTEVKINKETVLETTDGNPSDIFNWQYIAENKCVPFVATLDKNTEGFAYAMMSARWGGVWYPLTTCDETNPRGVCMKPKFVQDVDSKFSNGGQGQCRNPRDSFTKLGVYDRSKEAKQACISDDLCKAVSKNKNEKWTLFKEDQYLFGFDSYDLRRKLEKTLPTQDSCWKKKSETNFQEETDRFSSAGQKLLVKRLDRFGWGWSDANSAQGIPETSRLGIQIGNTGWFQFDGDTRTATSNTNFAVCRLDCVNPVCTKEEVVTCNKPTALTTRSSHYKDTGIGPCRDTGGRYPAWGKLENMSEADAKEECDKHAECIAVSAVHSSKILDCEYIDLIEKNKKWTAKYIYKNGVRYENKNFRQDILNKLLHSENQGKRFVCEEKEDDKRRDWTLFCSRKTDKEGICPNDGTGSQRQIWERDDSKTGYAEKQTLVYNDTNLSGVRMVHLPPNATYEKAQAACAKLNVKFPHKMRLCKYKEVCPDGEKNPLADGIRAFTDTFAENNTLVYTHNNNNKLTRVGHHLLSTCTRKDKQDNDSVSKAFCCTELKERQDNVWTKASCSDPSKTTKEECEASKHTWKLVKREEYGVPGICSDPSKKTEADCIATPHTWTEQSCSNKEGKSLPDKNTEAECIASNNPSATHTIRDPSTHSHYFPRTTWGTYECIKDKSQRNIVRLRKCSYYNDLSNNTMMSESNIEACNNEVGCKSKFTRGDNWLDRNKFKIQEPTKCWVKYH